MVSILHFRIKYPITLGSFNGTHCFSLGLSVRSVCWGGEKILAGTNGGEIFEISAADKEKPMTLVQVCMLVFASASV